MRSLFGSSESTSSQRGGDTGRIPRHSSGWKELLKHLQTQESLRILDIGPTSSTNINYITSLGPDAARLNQAIRNHWGIENKLHWALDVSFGEDLDRKRAGNAAQNFSILNRIALNLLRQDKTCNLAIKGKRLKAGWDNDYVLQLLEN